MPKTVRQWAMRKLTQSAQSFDWALTHLNDIDERYKEAHPEISLQIIEVMRLVEATQDVVEHLRELF